MSPENGLSQQTLDPASESASELKERRRLAALHRYGILDTPEAEAFDRITDLVARLLDVPIALVTFVDEDRQWFKSCVGVEQRETPREIAFCNYNIREEGVMVVEDATNDPRFADNPFVTGPPHIRFYAGAPLVTDDGYALGSLCVIDTEPRTLSDDDRQTLHTLAQVIVDELELHVSHAQRREILESIDGAFISVDPDWRLTYVNQQAEALLEQSADDLLGQNLWEAFPEARDLPFYEKYHAAVEDNRTVQFEAYVPPLETWFRVRAHPFEGGLSVYFDDITRQKKAQEELRLLYQAVEDMEEAVLITDNQLEAPGPHIEYVNPAFTDMTGYTEAEVRGMSPRLLQGPKTDRAALDHLREHLEAGEPVEAEAINYRKDGTTYELQWTMSPVWGDDGTIQHWVSVQRNVTEQRQRERDLRQTRELLTSIIETANVGICVTDRDGRFVRVNPAYTDLCGWSEDDLIGEHFTKVVPPEDRTYAADMHDRFIYDRDDEVPGEWRVLRKDGAIRDVIVTAGYLEQGGEPFQVTTVLDVTEQKCTARKLHDREQLLSAINAHVHEGIYRSTPSDGLVYANQAFADLFGYDTPEDMRALDDTTQLYVHPERREELHQKNRADGGLSGEEVLFRRADGSTFYGLVSGSVVRDTDGHLRFDATIRDITAAHEREEALRAERDLLQSIFHSSAAAITVLDEDGTIVQANDRAQEVLGIVPSDVKGRTYSDPAWHITAVGGGPFPDHELPFAQVMETGAPVYDVRHAIQWPEGKRRILSVNGAPLRDAEGSVTGGVFVVDDITEQVETQNELIEAKEEAESASRLKSAMMANMSHEVRTPLTSMIGFSEILKQELEGSLAEHAALIHRSSRRLHTTLESMLQLSKLRADAYTPQWEVVDLRQVAAEVIETMRPKATDHGLTLEFIHPDHSVDARTDRGATQRIVTNLLDNAIKFTPEGGTVTVCVNREEVPPHEGPPQQGSPQQEPPQQGLPQQGRPCIHVEDTGIGMAADAVDEMFEAFKQESEGLARSHEGSGLGLAIVQQLVDEIGGTITVESEQKEGTEMHVCFPQQAGEQMLKKTDDEDRRC
jgi:PAS domain S-box-containing protein